MKRFIAFQEFKLNIIMAWVVAVSHAMPETQLAT